MSSVFVYPINMRLEELDAQLAQAARSSGALRLALGAGLEALAARGGQHELGFSSLGAYARELCHCAPRTAEEARGLARRLEKLPLIRSALLTGEIVWGMAVLVARVATPSDEAEWLSAARELTVRRMRERIQQRQSKTGGARVGAAADLHGDPTGREGDSGSCFKLGPLRMKTLTVTVDAVDAWIFECARWVVERTGGGVSDEAVVEALLGEGESCLLPLVPREAIPEVESDPAHAAQAAWNAQLEAWRQQAEARCEGRFRQRGAEMPGAALAARDLGDLKTRTVEGLDTWLRQIARELAERDVKLGRLAEQLWKMDGWRRLGYATERQYVSERLGLSLTALKNKRQLARRLDVLPELAETLGSGALGSEAARLVARVATPETARDWIARAQERTVKHLREEVTAAEIMARLTAAPRIPPADHAVRELHKVESWVTSGAAFQAGVGLSSDEEGADYPTADGHVTGADALPQRRASGQTSAARLNATQTHPLAGQMSAAAMAKALRTVLHAFDATRRAPGSIRNLGRVTLRLRVSEENYWHYRSRERLHRRFGPPGPFLRFLCFSLIGTWQAALTTGVQYEYIYARDRFRCASPVCTRRDVTPHHLLFRSHGGSDHQENLLSLCVWCHLEGIHGGRLRAAPPSQDVHWKIGRSGHLVIHGRRRGTRYGHAAEGAPCPNPKRPMALPPTAPGTAVQFSPSSL